MLFLPLCLGIYLLLPLRLRTWYLLGVSLLYALLLRPVAVLPMLGSMALDYLALEHLHRHEGDYHRRRQAVILSTLKTVAVILGAWLYARATGTPALHGVMIYPLLGTGCVVSVFQRRAEGARNPALFGLYCCFFPRLFAGPVQHWEGFAHHPNLLNPGWDDLLTGFSRFLTGVLKLLLFYRYLSEIYQTISMFMLTETTVLSGWCRMLVLALMVYYRFSGYCDMALGLGGMFGLHLPQNFYYPYQSRGIWDFFHRFNAGVWLFLRRSIRSGPGEDRDSLLSHMLNLLVLGMLWGLWFGISLNYLFWGAFLALFAALEHHAFRDFFQRIPTLFQRLYTLPVILLSFALYAGPDPGQALQNLQIMLFLAPLETYNNRIMYLLSNNFAFLLMSCFFATNACSLLVGALRKSLPRLTRVLYAAADGLMLTAIAALLL